MSLVIMKVVIDRKTGERISEEIVDHNPDITEEEFYGPLAEIFYNDFKKKCFNGEIF